MGKLDGWEGMKPGVPIELPCMSYPLSPADVVKNCEGWDAICKRSQPMAGEPLRDGEELATLIYTSGTTGMPKGVMHTFANFAWALDAGLKRIPMSGNDRMLSYLPLAHVVERMLVEHGSSSSRAFITKCRRPNSTACSASLSSAASFARR